MKAQTTYQEGIATLTAAGVGVILTRTAEPYAAAEALHLAAMGKSSPWCFRRWDIVHGWQEWGPGKAPSDNPVVEPVLDPYAALKGVIARAREGKEAMMVMLGVHPFLKPDAPHPGMVEQLRELVHELPSFKYTRVILIVPTGFTLPQELSRDVPIFDLNLPTKGDLRAEMDFVFSSATKKGADEFLSEDQIAQALAVASGFTTIEAVTAFSKAFMAASDAKRTRVEFAPFLAEIAVQKTEAIKASEVLELMQGVKISEVGGLDLLKEWITIAKESFSEAAREFGVDCPKGICAIGPPGTGKSLVAKAIATQLEQPLIKFDVSRVFGSLVGQSEERVRATLKTLEAMAPCVVLLDEIDKGLGGAHQSSGDSGVSRRVLGAILTHMQESTAPLFWIFTANRAGGLPPEMLRKGRLDEVWAVRPPNKPEREAIFKIHLKKRKQPIPADLEVAVDASSGFVSAELEAAVKEAVKESFYRHKGRKTVSGDDIARQLRGMKPLSEAFPEDFAAMEEWAKNNARAASSIDAGFELVTSEDGPQTPSPRRRRILPTR